MWDLLRWRGISPLVHRYSVIVSIKGVAGPRSSTRCSLLCLLGARALLARMVSHSAEARAVLSWCLCTVGLGHAGRALLRPVARIDMSDPVVGLDDRGLE